MKKSLVVLFGCFSVHILGASEYTASHRVDLSQNGGNCILGNYLDRCRFASRCEHDGGTVLAVATVCTNRMDTSWRVESKRFPVGAGKEFVVRLEMSGDLPKSPYIKPGARIVWYDSAGKPMKTVDTLGNDVILETALVFPLRKKDNGVSVACTKAIVPQGAVKAAMVAEVDHPDVLPAEEVVLRRVEYFEHVKGHPWRFGDLDAPELEMLTDSPCVDLEAPISFRLVDASGIDYSKLRCKIDGVDVTGRLKFVDSADGGRICYYKSDAPWRMGSVVIVETECTDTRGNSAVEWGFVAFARDPVRHPKWTVRDDGVALRDGAPFFPFGICSVHANDPNEFNLDKAVRELKEAGLNLAHTYMVRNWKNHKPSAYYDDLVAACEKYGMMMLPEPTIRHGTLQSRDAMASQNVIFGRRCVSMFGWAIGDDTSRLQSPRDLKKLDRLCKSADRDLLTVSIDAVSSPEHQAPYIQYADVVIDELYPIRNAVAQDDEMANIARALDGSWEAVRISGVKNRSVMAMPQSFKGFGRWARFPSVDELRAMTFISLACRARGLVYYTYHSKGENKGAFSDPEYRRIFTSVAKEVSPLLPSLVMRDADRQPTVETVAGPAKNVLGSASVRCLLKEDGLLVAANTSHEEVKAKIMLPTGNIIECAFPRNGTLVKRIEMSAK